jgi:hypothetical protein
MEDFERLQSIIADLSERVVYAEIAGNKWLTPREAAHITGRDEKTLRTERERPGTLLVTNGETGKAVRYSLLSLRAYNQQRNYLPILETARRAAL